MTTQLLEQDEAVGGGRVPSTTRREMPVDRRERLLREVSRSVADRRVLDAIASVPRELFVDPDDAADAYADIPLSIGSGQTISQPTMVGIMLEALELDGSERVLEVGAGSGYLAALLSKLCRTVVSTEVVPGLVDRARKALAAAGVGNVEVVFTPDGLGAPEMGPYDAIVVSAATPTVPQPLVDQLRAGGRMAIPVGPRNTQVLLVCTRTPEGFRAEQRGGCRFVPLTGAHGYEGGQ